LAKSPDDIQVENTMQRFTISLNDALAEKFDALISTKGYSNRSEAVRDLIRAQIDDVSMAPSAAVWCVATVNYVYDHHDKTVVERVLSLQHEYHDLVITSLHTHLDHHDCLETVVMRGPAKAVRSFSQMLIALRGVRHGGVHVVPLDVEHRKLAHSHGHGQLGQHVHLKPLS
jgi:CopG family nickel-responsive transcriptional regulator